MAMPQCCYLAKGAKRPSHTTYTIKFDRIPFDPCNSIKRFDLCPFDQKNSTSLQPPQRNYASLQIVQNRIIGSIMKHSMSSKITAIEVLMGIPPIDFYCSSIEIKFLIKAVNNDGICHFCRIPLCRKHGTFCRIFSRQSGHRNSAKWARKLSTSAKTDF